MVPPAASGISCVMSSMAHRCAPCSGSESHLNNGLPPSPPPPRPPSPREQGGADPGRPRHPTGCAAAQPGPASRDTAAPRPAAVRSSSTRALAVPPAAAGAVQPHPHHRCAVLSRLWQFGVCQHAALWRPCCPKTRMLRHTRPGRRRRRSGSCRTAATAMLLAPQRLRPAITALMRLALGTVRWDAVVERGRQQRCIDAAAHRILLHWYQVNGWSTAPVASVHTSVPCQAPKSVPSPTGAVTPAHPAYTVPHCRRAE